LEEDPELLHGVLPGVLHKDIGPADSRRVQRMVQGIEPADSRRVLGMQLQLELGIDLAELFGVEVRIASRIRLTAQLAMPAAWLGRLDWVRHNNQLAISFWSNRLGHQ